MTPPADPAPSKRDRRDAAREKARAAREAEARRKRRNRWLLQGGLALGVVAAIAVVVLVVVQVAKPAGPGPENMASDGIVLQSDGAQGVEAVRTAAIPAGGTPTATDADSEGTAHIVVYEDYLCPICRDFDTANADLLESLVAGGDATLELHPISILDRLSQGTRYATRAANAAACVAESDPDAFLDVNTALYAQQPAENSRGLTDDELVALVQGAGVTDEAVESCVRDGSFEDWVGDATTRALDGPLPGSDLPAVSGTPTVLVDGQHYQGDVRDSAAFAAFVTQASGVEVPTTDEG